MTGIFGGQFGFVVPRFQTRNKKVAVEEFPDQSVKTQQVGTGTVKAIRIQNKSGLARLRVLFPSAEGLQAGQYVYVRGELYTHPWAKEVHEFEGTKFLLLPEQFVEAVETAPETGVSTSTAP